MCCMAIFAVLVLATALPQHEAIIDKRAPHSFSTVINNNSYCLPRIHWKNYEESKVIRYNQSNCTKAELLKCYCVSAKLGATMNSTEFVLGHCFFGCFVSKFSQYYDISTEGVLTDKNCDVFQRVGLLCGKCKQGYGIPSYSFSTHCVPCHNVTLWKRILQYIAVAYGPLTVFLILIVVFTVSVNSAPLNGFIFVCQLLTTPLILATVGVHFSNFGLGIYKVIGTLYGIWNLDFFRPVYSPFCIHPNMNVLHVIALDYLIAAYPLAVIVVLYTLVELHSRGCKLIVILWKPFRYCRACFRR